MSVSLREFNQHCLDQGVNYQSNYLGTILSSSSAAGSGKILDAVEYISYRLRQEPDALIDKTIQGDFWKDDTAASLLRNIINSTICPDLSRETISFGSQAIRPLPKCGAAEKYFIKTLLNPSSGCEVFTNKKEPVLIRKSIGMPTAQSLKDLTVNGVVYPRGTYFRIQTSRDILLGRYSPKPKNLKLLDINRINRIGFMRLSPAAFSLNERNDESLDFHKGRKLYSESEWQSIMIMTVDQMSSIIRLAINKSQAAVESQSTAAVNNLSQSCKLAKQ
jgi:hypothetical protein